MNKWRIWMVWWLIAPTTWACAAPGNGGPPEEASASAMPMSPGAGPTRIVPQGLPEVAITVSREFRYDAGDQTTIHEIEVAGSKVSNLDQVIEAVVAHRGGWGPGGGRTDAEVEAVLRSFLALLRLNNFEPIEEPSLEEDPSLDDPAALDRKRHLEGWRTAKRLSRGGDFPKYHPPQVTFHELEDGSRVAVLAFHEHSTQGRFHYWYRRVFAFRIDDGSRYTSEPRPKDPKAFPTGASVELAG